MDWRELGARWSSAAGDWEATRAVPLSVVRACGELGVFSISERCSEREAIFETLGAVSPSLAAIANVQLMVAETVRRWAAREPRDRLLDVLVRGEKIAALALSEPSAGTDIDAIETTCRDAGDHLELRGKKIYVTAGAIADVFLVFAKKDGAPIACLVQRDSPGLQITPLGDVLGLRAAHLATVELDGARCESILGAPGFGLTLVANYALLFGRLHVAWIACGLLRAVSQATLEWAVSRRIGGVPLSDRGQVAQALSRMEIDLRAARLLCQEASGALDAKSEEAAAAVLRAKYFAARACAEHCATAVRLHGASGCEDSQLIARAFRDSKILEIIEGASEAIEARVASSLIEAQRSRSK